MAVFSGFFIFCSIWITISSTINDQIYNFNKKDLKNYPTSIRKDISILKEKNVDIIFIPKVKDIYPSDFSKFIELKKLDQHTGSFEVGKLLKAIYIDSALKKAAKLDENNSNKTIAATPKNITWKSYKTLSDN